MTSSRLPGKVLMPVLEKSMLRRLIARLQAVSSIDQVIVATTINRNDDEVEKECQISGAECFRGSEEDVLSRVLQAALTYQLDVIVEITGDCPIIDISIVDLVITEFLAHNFDYVSNSNVRSYPDGMDVQVYKTDTLAHSSKLATTKLEREHVTLHIRQNPELYSRLDIKAPDSLCFPELGLTLDTEEDYFLLSKVIERLEPLDPYFGLKETLNFLHSNPELMSINRNIIRKGDS